MTAWQTIRLVAMREFSTRRKSFLVVTASLAGLGVGGIALTASQSESGPAVVLRGSEADIILGMLTVVVMFMAILFTGQTIMESVAEEKRSRVVEVVLGTVPPQHLLMGKVLAIGLMGLAEVLVALTVVAGAGQALDVFAIPRATTVGMFSAIVWFVLGVAVYAAVYAAGGSLLSPHENVANGAVPINLFLSIPYFIALTGVHAGDGIVLRVVSIFPLTAPIAMPLRTMRGYAQPWEIGLAAVLTIVAAYGLIRMAGRMYRSAILRGGKVKWRQAWSMAR